MSEIKEGSRVRLIKRDNWTASYRRLADSEREGVVDRVFTPLGSREALARVVFHKAGQSKERVEVMPLSDFSPSPNPHGDNS